MATARERVQSLDTRLRELEERFSNSGISQPTAAQLPSSAVLTSGAGQPASLAALQSGGQHQATNGLAHGFGRNETPVESAAALTAQTAPGSARTEPAPHVADAPAPLPSALPPRPNKATEVPLRLYREGLPHRDLGPPQSVWEADKNAAVLALADRVKELEHQLQTQQPQGQQQQPEGNDGGVDGVPTAAGRPVMPPPSLELLPGPRSVLGRSNASHTAPYAGSHPGGPPPAPVKYYPPAPAGQPLSADAAIARLQAAQGARAHARAFAASVAASAAATVPSIMMAKKRNENTMPPRGDHASENHHGATGAPQPTPLAGDGGSSVGVSAPLGYASAAASAAASFHVAALREAGPLQPAGQYPMVAAALAGGAPGTGSSTWEQGKMRALVSLEQQRDALRAQVESYRDIEDRHRRQLVELNEQHRQDLRDAAGVAGRKLERLMGAAWVAYARRLLVLRVSRALQAWRRVTTRNRRLRWATSVWRQRELEAVFTEWHMLVLTNRQERQARRRAIVRCRRTVLLAWVAATKDGCRLRRLERKAVLVRCRWLLAAWMQRAGELRCKRLRVRAAAAHRRSVLLRNGWRGLAGEVARQREAERALEQRLHRLLVLSAFQAWVAQARLGRRLDALYRRGLLRTVLRCWAAFTARMCMLRRKLRGLAGVWRQRRQAALLAGWAAAAHRLALLAAADAALRSAVRRELLSTAFTGLRLAPRERAWGRRRGVAALRAWHSVARRCARNRRVLQARCLSRNRATLAAMFDAWRLLGKARSVRLHLREIHRLQDLEPSYEHQMELVRQDRAAVQAHMQAVMAENGMLRAELLHSFVMTAEGGLLGKPLRWRCLLPDPDQILPPPRSRHSTLFLRGLQQPLGAAQTAMAHSSQSTFVHNAARAPLALPGSSESSMGRVSEQGQQLSGATGRRQEPLTETQAVMPSMAGVLVVFGGVSEDEWFRDLHVLEVSYTDDGASSFRWHPVEVRPEVEVLAGTGTLQAHVPALPDATAGSVASGCKLPVHTRRDHAACAVSPNEFVVVGGFDGTSELMDIHAVTVRTSGTGSGWSASVQHVLPRNRSPAGRSHHTVTSHGSGRSLYVFGGYMSSRGALGELWAFHLDHREWWQPNTTGDQPPPRRNHVAALVGGRLYVHGGFNGAECLGDTWALDLQSWHWERLNTTGSPPSPRRGHAAEVVDDRYLLVHGGYDGSGLLADGAVLDTATGVWRDLAAAGGPEDMPTSRAHHSLTLMGHVMVSLGGSGPMGPLLDVHLLESPPLLAGLAQQQRLVETAAVLSATQAAVADTEAALAVTQHRAEMAEQQLQVLRERSAELLSRHNAALADINRLKALVAAESVRVVAAEAATAEAQLALATAERRLRRTREGGQEVAAAARDMHDTVCDLREEVARLRSQLLATTQQQGHEASQLAAATAERQLLQQQLAG
ncbi:hypothetical protein Agub_g8661, partial [Astrephomene gubernaculifera]